MTVSNHSIEQLKRDLEKLKRQFGPFKTDVSKLDLKCICYPPGHFPFVEFPILVSIAYLVKCPLHGDRFPWNEQPGFIYVSKWLREKMCRHIQDRSPSFWFLGKAPRWVYEQWRTAHLASRPEDLYPAVEEAEPGPEGPIIYHRLKDGTRVKVVVSHYHRPRQAGEPENENWMERQKRKEKEDLDWRAETIRTLTNLVAARGAWIVFGEQLSGIERANCETQNR